ncbi:MAG: metallophosphoesterase [Candidatus Tectomicrobia bacterium]|nr:metallophosphoesterase [Candidatus Tectomicrobia bacterium]
MTGFRFIHSSDLHLGRRFGNYPEDIRGRLVEARHAVIDSISSAARNHGASHVLIGGDLFDTETPSDRVWRQALAAMAAADNIDWWIIPGNHDSLAAEALWDPIRAQRPDNMHFCDAAEPIEIAPGAMLLPSPVPSRSPGRDATAWMPDCSTPDGSLRIGLAHGGIVTFGSEDDGAETIPPDRVATAGLDYLALGDWHGFMRVGDRTYYSGSPERDRFKHQGRGVCLAVTIPGPGAAPEVAEVATGRFGWHDISLTLTPEQKASDALAGVLPENGSARRDTLVRVRASGWIHLPQRMELARTATTTAPEFGYFELNDSELATECMPKDLDDISPGGALRMAAEVLYDDAEDAAKSAEDRAIAAAALRRLYGYVTGDAR